jgi:broad specificity phosphatase PhoE
MTTLLLARHGETDWNRERRVQGSTDIPLNAAGIAQARALAASLASEPLAAVYASDLARARDTASAVATVHGLEIVLDPALREKHFGTWEGLTDTEIRKRFPDAVAGSWGDGETRAQLAARAVAAYERIRARHAEGSVLIVSHGGPLRVLLQHVGVDHGPIDNCAVFRVEL